MLCIYSSISSQKIVTNCLSVNYVKSMFEFLVMNHSIVKNPSYDANSSNTS